MRGDRQNANSVAGLAENHAEGKSAQREAPKRRLHDAEPIRHFADSPHRFEKRLVVSTAEVFRTRFVVRDLLLVFPRRVLMQHVPHLSSARTLRSSCSEVTT